MPKINESIDEGSLHYPDDLGVGFTYPDCVKITIGDKPGVSLKKVTSQVTALATKGQNSRLADLQKQRREEKPDSTILEELDRDISQLEARLKVKAVGFSDSIAIGEALVKGAGRVFSKLKADLRDTEKKNKFSMIKTIFLPMPENLTYNEPIDWSGTDLGIAKAAMDLMQGKGSAGALQGAALGQTGNVLAGGAGALVGKLLGSGVLGGALGAVALGGDAQGAIESTFRIKSNPFKEQTFQGVGFRPFEFSFTFNARSQSEVNTIRKIINSFRKYSKPKLESPDASIFKYPAEFQIEFLTNYGDDTLEPNKYLPKIKNCICKSVNTNFTTAGWKSFEDGAPSTITLQLGFEEIDIITQTDVQPDGGGY